MCTLVLFCSHQSVICIRFHECSLGKKEMSAI
uniref:Uncharacterized protein n=1 Tax=Arundo donax TaxID=35708 RepID=A0A0A9A6Y8_ARUDO